MGYYLSSSLENTDIADALQTALDDVTIGDVYMTEGDYLLGRKVIIPKNKALIMTGNNGSNYANNSDIKNNIFTKIKPTFDGDYCFELYDCASIRNGFINCEAMTSGGGILIDISQKVVRKINILGTVLSGGNHWSLNAVFINCDRPTGTIPGYGYFYNIDIGAQGFGNAVYLKRQDAYSSTDGTAANGVVWINGIRCYGNISACQRAAYFDTSNGVHAGGSSLIAFRIQGGAVPSKTTPSVELSGDDSVLDCQFHDIFATSPYQIVKYKLRAATNCIIRKYDRGSSDIIDNGTNTIYLTDVKNVKTPVYNTITSLVDGSTVQDGWYTKNGNIVTLNIRIVNLPVYAGWTTVYNLPYTPLAQKRLTCISSDNRLASVIVNTNGTLQVINSNAAPITIDIQCSYPTAP